MRAITSGSCEEIAKLAICPKKAGSNWACRRRRRHNRALRRAARRAAGGPMRTAAALRGAGSAGRPAPVVELAASPGRRFSCGGLDGGGKILQGGIDQGTTGERQFGREATAPLIGAQRMADDGGNGCGSSAKCARIARVSARNRSTLRVVSPMRADCPWPRQSGIVPRRNSPSRGGSAGPQPAQAVDLKAVQ